MNIKYRLKIVEVISAVHHSKFFCDLVNNYFLKITLSLQRMKGVALILAFYLFLGGLFPQMDYSQIGRMDDLLEHYREHKTEVLNAGQKAICLFEFIQLHFITQHKHDHPDGEENHANLPFQSIHSSLILIQVNAAELLPFFTNKNKPIQIPFAENFQPSEFISSVFLLPLD